MGYNLKNFVQNFQDMYVTKLNTVLDFPNNLSTIELNLIEQQLVDISNRLEELSVLTKLGAEENLNEYLKIIEILESKIEYIENLADMLLYINSYYDMNNVLDIKNYTLDSSVKNNNILYDSEQKGLTLMGVANNFNCPKVLTEANTYTYYNTNLSSHTGIILHSDYLDLIGIKSILLIKSNGTILRLPFADFEKTSYYIRHDLLTSTQISIEFNKDLTELSEEERKYYDSLKIILIDYTYLSEGSLNLESNEYTTSRLLNFIQQVDVPKDTFINLSLTMDLLDINRNKIETINTTLSLSNQKLCKRLDLVDFNTVSHIEGIYINNFYKENSKSITREYLESLSNKNEIYVVYLAKQSDKDVKNKFYKVLNNQGIVFTNKNIKHVKVYPLLEFYTFDKNQSPILKILTGITKDE